jgi:hypothetical protein
MYWHCMQDTSCVSSPVAQRRQGGQRFLSWIPTSVLISDAELQVSLFPSWYPRAWSWLRRPRTERRRTAHTLGKSIVEQMDHRAAGLQRRKRILRAMPYNILSLSLQSKVLEANVGDGKSVQGVDQYSTLPEPINLAWFDNVLLSSYSSSMWAFQINA